MDCDWKRLQGRRGGTRFCLSVAVTGLACVLVLGAQVASAATINVTTTNDENSSTPANVLCSLREAVIAANTNLPVGACPAGGHGLDTIVLPAGTYTLTIGGGGEDAAETGDLDVLGATTIQGNGANSTIIDANSLDRAFEARAVTGEDVTLVGLTVRGSPTEGVRASGGKLWIESAVIDLNAGYGVYANVDVTITSTTLRQNGRGGVSTPYSGYTELVDSLVVDNGAASVATDVAVGLSGAVTLTRTTVRNNATDWGAVRGEYLTITDSVVEGNYPHTPGASVPAVAPVCIMWSCGPTLLVERTTISGNTGDGIAGFGDDSIENVTISGNTGNGLLLAAGLTNIRNTTITGNGGYAIENRYGGIWGAADTKLTNTLVVGDCYNEEGWSFLTSLGGNLESPGDTCKLTASGDQPNVADPKLGPLAMNGGLTKTHALLAGSPAIGHGNDGACLATDQRGATRPAPAGGHCDVGSYEYNTGCGASLEAAGAAPVALLLARRRRRTAAR